MVVFLRSISRVTILHRNIFAYIEGLVLQQLQTVRLYIWKNFLDVLYVSSVLLHTFNPTPLSANLSHKTSESIVKDILSALKQKSRIFFEVFIL